jgi:predicted RNA-binding Zn ribbon-like protein
VSGGPLWIAFVNSTARAGRPDALGSVDAYLGWLTRAGELGPDRALVLRQRAASQPAGATAALMDAQRVRAALGLLTDRALPPERGVHVALAEINRVLGRSAGQRRLVPDGRGGVDWEFQPSGDVWAALLLPVVESAALTLRTRRLDRVRRCPGCGVAFEDASRSGSRRWCDMRTCGNRAKQQRHRAAPR